MHSRNTFVDSLRIRNDLLAANSMAAPPQFPLYWSGRSLTDSEISILEVPNGSLSRQIGTRFPHLPKLMKMQVLPFLDLLPAVVEVTVAIAWYQHSSSPNMDRGARPCIGELVQVANSVHHRILGLNAGSCVADTKGPLEILRLATLIYSNLTIFPLGLPSGVPAMLASRLRSACEAEDGCQEMIFPLHHRLWILMMGAIGALSEGSLLSWYTNRLSKLISFSCEDEWDRCMNILRGFLWWDYVCASYAKGIWDIIYPASTAFGPATNDGLGGAAASSINTI